MNTLKNVVKKAIAVGSGAIMLGATTGAALADLSDYPAPFIQNGQFDGMIVVGEQAASSDIIGAIDIAASLQASATTPVMGGGGSTRTVLTGDAAQIGDSSDFLEIGEQIGAVTETLTDADLEILESGSISTQAGTTDFTQTLDLDTGASGTSNRVVLAENDDDETGMFFLIEDGEPVFTYEVEFTSGLESDIEVVTGASNDVAEDLEDESIYLMGQWYTMSVAQAEGTQIELTLLAGDVSDTLTQGETKTYEIDGEEYEVTVLAIGNNGDSVKFLINGEATDSMSVDDTETLSGGLEIGVRDIIETTAYRESDPGSIVEFYLGANKIELTDSDVTTDDGGASVEINDENIEDLDADINAIISGTSSVRINSLSFTLNADANAGTDIFLGAGDGLREALDEPEGMLGSNWDIVFQGLSEPDTTEVAFEASGDDEYELVFTNRRGDQYSVPYAVVTGAATMDFGDADDDFHFYESLTIGATENVVTATSFMIEDDDYFLLTSEDQDESGDSYVLQWDDMDTDDSTLSFTNVATGQEVVATYSTVYSNTTVYAPTILAASAESGDITIGGKDFSFWLRNESNVFTLAIDQDNDGALAGIVLANISAATTEDPVNVVVRGGGLLALTNEMPEGGDGAWTATLTTTAEDMDNDVASTATFDFTTAGSEFDATIGTTLFEVSVQDEDLTRAVTRYGAWIEATDETGDTDSISIMYPVEQVEALVYVVGGEVQSSTSASGGSGARVNPISVGSAVLDTDVRYDQDNMIVVGGPCVNTMAAQLLGNPADCTEGFVQGRAMIQLFDTGANTAILVAGFEAQDTVGASRVLAEYADYDLMGDSVDVVVESLNNIRVQSNDE